MGNSRDEKRADLRKRLIDAAEEQIAEHGCASLKARAVTAQAGCALGALYNAFDDLDRLIMHVNSRTLSRLGDTLQSAQADPEATAEDLMQALAARYVAFACDNRLLWISLFEHRPPEGQDIPDWHRQEHDVLIKGIVAPLKRLRPDLNETDLALRARTTFAAVHGVVLLALQGRFVGVPMEALHQEISALVSTMTRGARLAGKD